MRTPNKDVRYTCECGTAFSLRKTVSHNPRCPRCKKKDVKRRYKAAEYWKLSKYKERNHIERLKREYGLSKDRYDQILEQQGGTCAICKDTEILKRELGERSHLVIDHNHLTGEMRGLLCHACNRALGVFHDDLSMIRSCLSYLMKFDKRKSWDEYFLDIAELVSTRSKDPSTKVGAVIVRDKTILSTGYNGFARGVNDNIPERYDRPEKYLWTIHAEENAILNAGRIGIKTEGASLYVTPMHPCSNCALSIVQSGIKEVIFKKSIENPRFEKSFEKAAEIFNACNILVRIPDTPMVSEKST